MEEEIASDGPQYYVDFEGDGGGRHSMPVMVAWRQCHEHRPAEAASAAQDSDPLETVAQIANHCSETADYLLEDTPLKEAIFRVLLLGGNEPMTAQQVSEALTSRWAMSAYPRDLSPRVIGRLLEYSENYGVVAVAEPEPEPEPIVVEEEDDEEEATE